MTIQVYTLWASMKDSEPSPWMIAAEDEFSWEGDPERCERVMADARALAERNEWDVREVTLTVSLDKICEAFSPVDVEAEVEEARP